jgi:cold shock CspA family protein
MDPCSEIYADKGLGFVTVADPTLSCPHGRLWYNVEKGFGIVAADRGGKDVFVHATTLSRSGLGELSEGQRVRMQIGLTRHAAVFTVDCWPKSICGLLRLRARSCYATTSPKSAGEIESRWADDAVGRDR